MGEPRNTRERIQQVAIELFNKEGYDRTSLREIAEAVGLTKAALYYHFKTKEDLAASYFDDFIAAVRKLCDWATEQPSSLNTRREILRRYSAILQVHGATLRFMHHNQPAMKHLSRGEDSKQIMRQVHNSLMPEEVQPIQRLRAVNAIMTMHMAWFIELEGNPDPQELAAPALSIAVELIETNER